MYRKVYRLCLLAVVIMAIAGGIYYYLHYSQRQSDITEGTLVQMGEWA